jgi:CHAP domain-containing protein
MSKLVTAGLLLVAGCCLTAVGLPALVPPADMAEPRLEASVQAAPLVRLPVGATTGRMLRRDGLQPLVTDVPPGGYPHSTYAWGNCTWWVAYNRSVPPYLGDAWKWLATAAAAGMPTSAQPSVGAIVVYRPSPSYDVLHGHVAVVIAVGPTSFRVSEMNFAGLGVVDERDSPWPDWHVEGFIQ